MTIRLADMQACFEGVIPSIIATTAADGMPNISYLSHVVMVDDAHIALSNQFFAKTAANIRANLKVTLMLVDGDTGAQYQLDILFKHSVETGPLFDHVALQLKASSAQIGMAGIMRLRSADVFRVLGIVEVPSAVDVAPTPRFRTASVAAISRISQAMNGESELGGVVDAMQVGIDAELGFGHSLVLLRDTARSTLVTVGSRGYETSGIGSEVSMDDGLISSAAIHGQPIKVSDMSRVRRLGEAIGSKLQTDENATRTIALPSLPDAMSQIAVPISAWGKTSGVLFVESRRRMAFRNDDVAILELLARQVATALQIAEAENDEITEPAIPAPSPILDGETVQITHHTFDDSIFIDNDYVIKGVAGRLLAFLIDLNIREGRNEFTNREIRLSDSLRLPEFKDNLETRLLLLRRRLESKDLPIKILSSGRGKLTLIMTGTPVLRTVS